MKKFIAIVIVGLILFCSCDSRTPQQKEREHREYVGKCCQNHSELIELTFKDEHGEKRTHEFVIVYNSETTSGLTHWPDCKYCKNRF